MQTLQVYRTVSEYPQAEKLTIPETRLPKG